MQFFSKLTRKDKKEIYGLSEEETKKILNISSLNLKNPEKYIKKMVKDFV